MMDQVDEASIIGNADEDGLTEIYRVVDKLPGDEIRERLPWLTIISWTYDREARNGMPPDPINTQTVALELAIDAPPRYPIEIDLFHDSEWRVVQMMRGSTRQA